MNREEKRARNTRYWCHQVNNLSCTDRFSHNIFKNALLISFASARAAQHELNGDVAAPPRALQPRFTLSLLNGTAV